jgi:antitoxin component YwqK of YwqJK toxin-antitoxin module
MYLFAKDVIKTPDDWWTGALATYVKQGADERHGDWASWHTNGSLEMRGQFDHGLEVGAFIYWHPNGQKYAEGTFEEGAETGRWVWWHPNGQKSAEGMYTDGAPDQRWTYWTEDGRVAQRADYSHGQGVIADRPAQPAAAAPARTSATPTPATRR